MTDSLLIKTRLQYAGAGDFSSLPLIADYGYGKDYLNGALAKCFQYRDVVPISSGITFSIADFAAVNTVYLLNEDYTNFVTLTWTRSSGATTETVQVPPRQPAIIPGLGIDLVHVVVVADTAPCLCGVIIVGS